MAVYGYLFIKKKKNHKSHAIDLLLCMFHEERNIKNYWKDNESWLELEMFLNCFRRVHMGIIASDKRKW